MSCERLLFATLPTKEFVDYLESNGIIPTEEEISSMPMGSAMPMLSGIENSITQVVGQQCGWSEKEVSSTLNKIVNHA